MQKRVATPNIFLYLILRAVSIVLLKLLFFERSSWTIWDINKTIAVDPGVVQLHDSQRIKVGSLAFVPCLSCPAKLPCILHQRPHHYMLEMGTHVGELPSGGGDWDAATHLNVDQPPRKQVMKRELRKPLR